MTGEQPEISPATLPGKNRGCLFWVVVLAVVVGGGGYLAYRYAKHRIVTAYTDTIPLDLGELALSPAELGELDGRLAAFAHALRNKTPVEPLVLTSEELTALVLRSPGFRRLGGRARFSIGDGEIRGDLSVPLERMGYPDRWFNGSVAFAVTLENGVLVVTLRSASVKGEPVPAWIIQKLRDRNLAKDLYDKPEAAGFIARLESIEVGHGRITVVPRLQRRVATTSAVPPPAHSVARFRARQGEPAGHWESLPRRMSARALPEPLTRRGRQETCDRRPVPCCGGGSPRRTSRRP